MMVALSQKIKLTRAIETLSRARLYLAQSNFGLAREDVQSAQDLLVELHDETGDNVLAQAISRLDLALNNLPEFPVIASGDLGNCLANFDDGQASESNNGNLHT